ncbi:MAG: zinc-ribbon domain-containing protein [Candidatus Micrarchaeota archaeon]
MKTCTSCKYKNEDDAKICTNCGSRMRTTPEPAQNPKW